MQSNKRKKLLINRPFQLSFIGYTIIMLMILIGIFEAANNYFFWKFAQKGIELGLPADHVFFQFIGRQREEMNMIFFITSVFALILLSVYGMYMSNKIAGPLYRLTTQLKEMTRRGSKEEINFRDGDYFPEVAEAFNDFIKNQTGG